MKIVSQYLKMIIFLQKKNIVLYAYQYHQFQTAALRLPIWLCLWPYRRSHPLNIMLTTPNYRSSVSRSATDKIFMNYRK